MNTQIEHSAASAHAAGKTLRDIHVLTLTPFFPSASDAVNGCFISESLSALSSCGVISSVTAVQPVHQPRKCPSPSAPAEWLRFPQLPGNFGLATAGPFLFTRLFGHVRRLHERHPVDVIHAHSALPCGHAAALLSERLGIPFVVTIHGLDVFNVCFEDGWRAAWRSRVSHRVYRQAKSVICVSDRIRQNLVKGMDQRVPSAVVYNGTDIELFLPGNAAQSEFRSILVVGTLLRGKGQELVMKAVHKIRDLYPDLRCQFIGEGADGERFAALARQLGIEQRVQFLGRQTRAQVAQAMRDCTMFALPSYYEGLGCVYLEAMACGKAVIACRGQGIGEIVQHGVNGWLVGINDVEELAEGILTLLKTPDLRTQIGAAARQTIEQNLTFAHQAKQLRKIYEEAVQ